jgi:hypothetical protein
MNKILVFLRSRPYVYRVNETAILKPVGRKPILSERGDGLKPWQVKLFEYQIEWLMAQEPNANAALREIIERAIEAERRPRKAKR